MLFVSLESFLQLLLNENVHFMIGVRFLSSFLVILDLDFLIGSLRVAHWSIEWPYFPWHWQNVFLIEDISSSEASLLEFLKDTAFCFLEFPFFFLGGFLTPGGCARVSRFSILISKKLIISWIALST